MFSSFSSLRQQWFPSESPTLTEENVPRQDGKVFIVTGGNSGCGFELINALYPSGATIYMAARSQDKAEQAIQQIKSKWPNATNPSTIKYLHLDLNDLTTIKSTAETFMKQETKLHVLWNNAGIAGVPKGTATKQNLEAHIGVNCVAPLALAQALLPMLKETATSATPGSVRVVWTSSYIAEGGTPKRGFDLKTLDAGGAKDPTKDYANSKLGNWLLSIEMSRRYGKGKDGLLSVCQNPGNLSTPVWKHQSRLFMMLLNPILAEPKYGGYTELWAGLSEDLTMEDGGAYVIPWGRKHTPARSDLYQAIDVKDDNNLAAKFWNWCDAKVKDHS